MKLSHSKVILGILVTFAYIALSVFSLFMLAGHLSHDGMPMTDCPYMAGQHSVCPMDFSSHIAAWEDMVRSILPTLLLLIVVAFAVVWWQAREENGPPLFLRRRPERQISPYTELFSSGILNPKIP
jgi:ABC-type uncharacterized transport system permease subunit